MVPSSAAYALTTVPTNLADCAPFASVAPPGMEDAERIRRDELVRVGDLRLAAGESESALASYREAERVDETMAELQFRIGKLHQQQSRSDLARERLTLARDLAVLQEQGFAAKKIVPVDLMPQTDHVETLALLTEQPLSAS